MEILLLFAFATAQSSQLDIEVGKITERLEFEKVPSSWRIKYEEAVREDVELLLAAFKVPSNKLEQVTASVCAAWADQYAYDEDFLLRQDHSGKGPDELALAMKDWSERRPSHPEQLVQIVVSHMGGGTWSEEANRYYELKERALRLRYLSQEQEVERKHATSQIMRNRSTAPQFQTYDGKPVPAVYGTKSIAKQNEEARKLKEVELRRLRAIKFRSQACWWNEALARSDTPEPAENFKLQDEGDWKSELQPLVPIKDRLWMRCTEELNRLESSQVLSTWESEAARQHFKTLWQRVQAYKAELADEFEELNKLNSRSELRSRLAEVLQLFDPLVHELRARLATVRT